MEQQIKRALRIKGHKFYWGIDASGLTVKIKTKKRVKEFLKMNKLMSEIYEVTTYYGENNYTVIYRKRG